MRTLRTCTSCPRSHFGLLHLRGFNLEHREILLVLAKPCFFVKCSPMEKDGTASLHSGHSIGCVRAWRARVSGIAEKPLCAIANTPQV